MHDRGSREQIQDVESELQEAMSENVLAEESLLDGKYSPTYHKCRLKIMVPSKLM